MAALPLIITVATGVVLGLRWGGRMANLTHWRPALWPAAVAGIALGLLVDILALVGAPALVLSVVSMALVMVWSLWNIRLGGMVLIALGMASNLIVTLLNAGMPVSGRALERAGLVTAAAPGTVQLTGGRHLADGETLGFLGGTIPLPTHQVVSIGDLLLLAGAGLVIASVLCRRRVSRTITLPGARDLRGGLAVMGQGPAPRRGPGLHPSRLGGRTVANRPGSVHVRPTEPAHQG